MTDAAIVSLANIVATIAGFVHVAWRLHVAARVLRLQREWDVTDRARARADTATKAAMRDAVIVSKIAVVADIADGNK